MNKFTMRRELPTKCRWKSRTDKKNKMRPMDKFSRRRKVPIKCSRRRRDLPTEN
jgi:hypothetical protein